MNKNLKKLLCALLAVMVICAMTACRNGGETTRPSVPEKIPTDTTTTGMLTAGTVPDGEGVEDWNGPTETEPTTIESTREGTETVQEPDEEDHIDPSVEPSELDQTDPPEPTQNPSQTKNDEEPSIQPTQSQCDIQEPVVLTYEEYMALSPAEQQAYYESFPSLEDYIAWHNAALAEYEENQDTIVATGPIDIGDYMTP